MKLKFPFDAVETGCFSAILFDDDAHQNIPAVLHLRKFFQRYGSALVKLYIAVQNHHAGKDIRKAEAAENTASHSRAVAELSSDDPAGALTKRAVKVLI